MATDLGLRISDFIKIKKEDLPSLDQEPPIPFELMTGKEEIVAYGFLSHETVDILKNYLPTLKKDNLHLFPSNAKTHISDEWLNRLLQKLARKAQINLNGKSLTFHCFRKLFLSSAENSGIGSIVGKKLCGRAIPKSYDTYLTTLRLKEKFIQLKKYLTITPPVKTKEDQEELVTLKKVVVRLQEDFTIEKKKTEVLTEELATVKRMVNDMGKQLQKAQKGTTLWEQAQKMGFMGVNQGEPTT